MNMTVTNNDLGSVILEGAEFRDELLAFTEADTYAEGTILARLTADDTLVPFATGGADGSETPLAILTYDVEATEAADIPARVGVAGQYRAQRLVIHADGDDSNVTPAILDQLRDYGLVPIDVNELGILDNQ